MWVIVMLAGMLNAGAGLEAGHTEMTDLHFKFLSREACEEARPEIEKYVVDGMKDAFGEENILAITVCWTPPSDPA